MIRNVVVVGASLAGLRAVEALRTGGFEGSITVIGDEAHVPYDRPPLSKRLLSGDWEPDRIALRRPDDMGSLDATWRQGVAATGLNLATGEVRLADGEAVPFEGLIVATGSTPRKMPGQDEHPHVVTLRTLDDALDLRRRIAGGGRRVAVIGAGFIGLEVAATARKLGNEVIVLEGAEAPLMRGLGATMGAAVAEVHADHGVEIRCNVQVEGFASSAVLIDGGWHEPADVVVVGIGVVPATAWLETSGLSLRDGVLCTPSLNTGHPFVYAAGDIARWFNPLFGEEMRVEHWTNAAEQGALAASNLISEAAGQTLVDYAPVPFFWSEQYDRRIQFLGRAGPDDGVRVVAGSIEQRQFLAIYGRGDRLSGVLGVNMPRAVMPFRKHLMDRIGFVDAIEIASLIE
jgi:NADPH-dependent 2,4-dienoyl-CoA reductase/sulfur reductase-like enzyme